MTDRDDHIEARRLEQLWSGDFGDAYVDRNLNAYDPRRPFWDAMITRLRPTRVLEVGCNVGGNLRWIAPHLDDGAVYGIDVNRKALTLIHEFVPHANVLVESARELPFRDGWFDFAFTMGVLIHQPDESLGEVVSELARVTSRYVLCGEYDAPETTEVSYRGIGGSLFRRDYAAIFLDTVPSLELIDSGHLTAEDGFDDITWHLFEKR